MRVEYLINKDTLTGSVLLLFSIIFLIEVRGWPDYSYMRVVGPEVFPTLILSLIGLLSLKIIYNGVKVSKEQVTTTDTEDDKIKNTFADLLRNISPILLMLLIVILYALSLRYLGFLLSTFISIFIMMSVLKVKGLVKKVVITIGILAFAYVTFIYALNIPLPTGIIWR